MNLKERIKEAKNLEKEIKLKDKRIRDLRKEIYSELETKFPEFIHRNQKREDAFSVSEFENGMQTLLRSMLKSDKIIKVSFDRKRMDSDQNLVVDRKILYLTRLHGIKEPRLHSYYTFLPGHYRNDEIFELKEGVYKSSRKAIDFSVLKNRLEIDQSKFTKFIEFLSEIIQLWKSYVDTEKEFLFYSKEFKDLNDLNEWDDLEIFEKYIENIPKFSKTYANYTKLIQSFKEIQTKLLQEIEDYNKPFKVFLKLKKSSDSETVF